MARAYSIIANEGRFTTTRYLLDEESTQEEIIDRVYAGILRENLVYTANKHDGLTFPTFAGKTGTAERDVDRAVFSKFSNKKKTAKNDAWYVFVVHSPRLNTELVVALRIEKTTRRSGEARNWMRDMVVPILRELEYM
jgi:cell division protein FtsI/penicillin-binding protein 2